MSTNKAVEPIIIIKKNRHAHAAAHGGAWKVAYADFVTAMMALFIVLWLQGANDGVKKAVGAYFSDPAGKNNQLGSGVAGIGEALLVSQDGMSKLKDTLEAALRQVPELDKLKSQVEMTVTAEGLRIELLETEAGFFFHSGNSVPTPVAKQLISTLAAEVAKLKNSVMIEGHTDSRLFGPGRVYTNWELSTDRANAARRIMESTGVSPDKISQVRGFSDRRLRDAKHPEDPANRRVSMIVQSEPLASGKAPAAQKH